MQICAVANDLRTVSGSIESLTARLVLSHAEAAAGMGMDLARGGRSMLSTLNFQPPTSITIVHYFDGTVSESEGVSAVSFEQKKALCLDVLASCRARALGAWVPQQLEVHLHHDLAFTFSFASQHAEP
jgi:hypothetical protein